MMYVAFAPIVGKDMCSICGAAMKENLKATMMIGGLVKYAEGGT